MCHYFYRRDGLCCIYTSIYLKDVLKENITRIVMNQRYMETCIPMKRN